MTATQIQGPFGTSVQHCSARLPDNVRAGTRRCNDTNDSSYVLDMPELEELMRCKSDGGAPPPTQRRHPATAPPATQAPPASLAATSLSSTQRSDGAGTTLVQQLQHASLENHICASACASRSESGSSTCHPSLAARANAKHVLHESLHARSAADAASVAGSAAGIGERLRSTGAWSLGGLLGSPAWHARCSSGACTFKSARAFRCR